MSDLITIADQPRLALPASHPFMVMWAAYVGELGEMHRVIADERIEACKFAVNEMDVTERFKKSVIQQLDHLKYFHDSTVTSWDTIEDISSLFGWTVE
jgi:hypothetical protein